MLFTKLKLTSLVNMTLYKILIVPLSIKYKLQKQQLYAIGIYVCYNDEVGPYRGDTAIPMMYTSRAATIMGKLNYDLFYNDSVTDYRYLVIIISKESMKSSMGKAGTLWMSTAHVTLLIN